MPTQGATEPRWLLLIHQIPPSPAYLRVKIGRRLQKIGAVPVKNSVYVLPNTEHAREHFSWVAREIAAGRGDSNICESNFVGERSNQGVEALFNDARGEDYLTLTKDARELRKSLLGKKRLSDAARAEAEGVMSRLKRRLGDLAQIDFFGAPGRQTTEALLLENDSLLSERLPSAGRVREAPIAPVSACTWVTRKNVHVDRIASAWLIRRFIDSKARFKFVSATGHVPKKGELRFDMFEAEYTHDGDRCTFEVLLDRFRLETPGLRAIAEIVHEIDVSDGKFAPPEVAGIDRIINGLSMTEPDDNQRLAVGSAVFDCLLGALKRPRRERP